MDLCTAMERVWDSPLDETHKEDCLRFLDMLAELGDSKCYANSKGVYMHLLFEKADVTFLRECVVVNVPQRWQFGDVDAVFESPALACMFGPFDFLSPTFALRKYLNDIFNCVIFPDRPQD